MNRLIDAVVVAGVKPGSTDPTILWSHDADGCSDPAHLRAAPIFCFPDKCFLEPVSALESETYTFVLTASDGAKQFGYCRRYLPPGNAPRTPEAFCVISRLRSYAAFSRLVVALEETAKFSLDMLKSELVALCSWQPDGKNSVLWLRLKGEPVPLLPRLVNDICSFSDSRLGVLLEYLDPAEVIALHHMVLCEQRVLIISSKLSRITACTHAIAALLYPFQWQQVFIPLLPHSLINYVCAPMPFLIGLPADFLPEVRKLPLEEVVFVDLDTGVINADANALTSLPKRQSQALAGAIAQRYIDKSSGRRRCSDWRGVAFVFFEFMLYVLGNYRSQLKWKGDVASFDRESFGGTHPSKSIRKMMSVLIHSQMFEVFSREREEMAMKKCPTDGVFEECVSILAKRNESSSALYSPSFLERGPQATAIQSQMLSATKRFLIPSKPDPTTIDMSKLIEIPQLNIDAKKVSDRVKFWSSEKAKASSLATPSASAGSDRAAVDVPTADLLGILAAPEITAKSLHRASISSMPVAFPAVLDLSSTIGSPPLHFAAADSDPTALDIGSSRDATPRTDLLFDFGEQSVSSSSSSTPVTQSRAKIAAAAAASSGNFFDNDLDLLSLSMSTPAIVPISSTTSNTDNFADFSAAGFGDAPLKNSVTQPRDSVIGAIMDLAATHGQQQQQQSGGVTRQPFPDMMGTQRPQTFIRPTGTQLQPHPMYSMQPPSMPMGHPHMGSGAMSGWGSGTMQPRPHMNGMGMGAGMGMGQVGASAGFGMASGSGGFGFGKDMSSTNPFGSNMTNGFAGPKPMSSQAPRPAVPAATVGKPSVTTPAAVDPFADLSSLLKKK